jgi:hypothetical protein
MRYLLLIVPCSGHRLTACCNEGQKGHLMTAIYIIHLNTNSVEKQKISKDENE